MNKKALAITVGALSAVTVLLLSRKQLGSVGAQKTLYVHMPADIRGKDTQGMSLSQVVNTYGQTEQKRS